MVKADVVIIGGGAAGIFAAINIASANSSLKIVVLEKTSKLLAKVKVSGGGRCNVTHACFDPKELVKYYPRGEKELLGSFYQFQPQDTIEWFSKRGIVLKTEDDGRMFPVSNSSQTIIDCFLKEIEQHRVEVRYQSAVKLIEKIADGFELQLPNEALTTNHLIIATGGFHKIEGYHFMKNLHHTIVNPVPSLFTFNLPQNELLELQGLVANVVVKIVGSKFVEKGALLVTHWGVSGPVILKLSAWAALFLNEKKYAFDFLINWLPNYTENSLREFLSQQKRDFGSKKVFNQLELDIPKKLKYFLLKKANISSDLKWAEVNKKQFNKLIQLLTSDNYSSKGKTTFKQEFVSCGGVKLSEVNFKTMESKKNEGLYFAGEVLNIDALTGGFNFQNAWTTSWIAAQHIAQKGSNS